MDVKSWLSKLPTVAEVRPKQCVGCGLAARPLGGRIRVQGHGKRERQAWGPAAPGATPAVVSLLVRRYRCVACKALTTVVPGETLTKRLYTAPAVGWALALLGLLAATPSAIRRAVSPWRVWGLSAPARWTTLQRWARAAATGRLFPSVRPMPPEWPTRQQAARVATVLAACPLPSPEPPPLAVQAFLGAALAR